MSSYTEKNYIGDWLFGETDAQRLRYSRTAITILAGSGAERALKSGEVLGKISTGTATATAFAGNTSGSGTVGTITVGAGAKVGDYKVVIIEPGSNAGKFTVEDPDGVTIGVGTVAVAFSGGGLSFTISDATDFVSGDGFTITVAAGSGKYVALDLAGTDGRQNAAGILALDATAPDGADVAATAIIRSAVVVSDKLTWPSGITTNQKNAALAQLAALGIVNKAAA